MLRLNPGPSLDLPFMKRSTAEPPEEAEGLPTALAAGPIRLRLAGPQAHPPSPSKGSSAALSVGKKWILLVKSNLSGPVNKKA